MSTAKDVLADLPLPLRWVLFPLLVLVAFVVLWLDIE